LKIVLCESTKPIPDALFICAKAKRPVGKINPYFCLKVILYLKGHFNFIDIIVFQQHELCRGIIDFKDKNKLWIEDDVQSSFIKL